MATLRQNIKVIMPNSIELKRVLNTKTPSVYVIRCFDYYKIGYSFNIESRIENMRTNNPFPLKVVYVAQTPQYKELEKALHSQFAYRRVYREWFKLEPEDEEKIEEFMANFVWQEK
jgi:hypothetical protein